MLRRVCLLVAISSVLIAAADKEMKFEVLSVRPVQTDSPGGGFNFGPTPNGFSSRLSVWQAIMLAYASGDATNTTGAA
jgi:hypothetical protein